MDIYGQKTCTDGYLGQENVLMDIYGQKTSTDRFRVPILHTDCNMSREMHQWKCTTDGYLGQEKLGPGKRSVDA